MQLKNLCDQELLSNIKSLVSRERELLGQILHHLREVDRRRLFSDLKYKSLFEYAVKELRYSEDQAYRRINAMRLIKELPQIEEKVASGSLSLSALSAAGSLFKAESKHNTPMSAVKKLEVLSALTNKSRREADAIVQTFTNLPKETLKPESRVNPNLQDKIDKVKGLIAHSHANLSNMELLERLCDDFLQRHDNELMKKSAPPRKGALIGKRAISVAVRRFVWQRDKSKCQNCGSAHAVQVDHITPVALGGDNSTENLRLLCRMCNQRAAIHKLGQKTMDNYLSKSAPARNGALARQTNLGGTRKDL